MELPRIAPYELPEPAGYPAARVDWQIDSARAALLVHDMQRYFLRPYAGAPVPALLAGLARLLRVCRAAGVPVIYTAQPGRQSATERGLLTDMWGPGIGAVVDSAPELERIDDAVAPEPGDAELVKWRYSAFQRTPLADVLAEHGRDQLVITGIYASIGCLATAVEAFMRDVQPFLVGDGVADFSRTDHDSAIDYVARRAGVVTSLRAVEHALTPTPAQVRA
jgi:bifunctional isochorismate lyase / aryl carrier protein